MNFDSNSNTRPVKRHFIHDFVKLVIISLADISCAVEIAKTEAGSLLGAEFVLTLQKVRIERNRRIIAKYKRSSIKTQNLGSCPKRKCIIFIKALVGGG
jgi:hypothetical protein